MKQFLNNKFTKKGNSTTKHNIVVLTFIAGIMICQIFTLSASAGDIFGLNEHENSALGYLNPPVSTNSSVTTCPVYDPFDNTNIYTCVRAVGPTDIQIGVAGAFYFETYVESGVFFFNDSYTVTTFAPVGAKVSANGSSFSDAITIPITRNAIGYARSPNFYVKGTIVGSNAVWAYSSFNNNGNYLPLNITSAAPPPPPPPPPPLPVSSSLVSYSSDLAVGWTSNLKVKVVGATPNSNDLIQVTTSNTSKMKFSLSASGPFSNAISVPLQIGSDGGGETVYFFVKGMSDSGESVVPKITACGSTLPCIPPYSMRVFNVNSVELHTYSDNSLSSPNIPLDNNPNTGGGLRIYPEKKTPGDNADIVKRQYVTVVAKLRTPLSGKKIRFKVFDIDDPSSDDPIVDPNGSVGNDNRSNSYFFTDSFAAKSNERTTDANGEARVTLAVGQNPGDNYRVVATAVVTSVNNSAANNLLDNVTVNGVVLSYEGNQIAMGSFSSDPATATPSLTVWRRLHIERDSMGAVTGNSVGGTIMDVQQGATTTKLVLSTPSVPAQSMQSGRFEGGRIHISGETPNSPNASFKVVKSGTTSLMVEGIVPEVMTGYEFTMWDDDDFNLNDGTNQDGDNGEDIPTPDTSLLQDSDNPALNRMAAAYVRPVYDLTHEGTNVPFVLNLTMNAAGDGAASIRSLFEFNNVGTEADPNFWTVYVLNAYQFLRQADIDPFSETVDQDTATGCVDAINGQGVVIFVEALAEVVRSKAAKGELPSEQDTPKGTLVHEIAHLFSSQDGDGEAMSEGTGSTTYSPTTLDHIRDTVHP